MLSKPRILSVSPTGLNNSIKKELSCKIFLYAILVLNKCAYQTVDA